MTLKTAQLFSTEMGKVPIPRVRHNWLALENPRLSCDEKSSSVFHKFDDCFDIFVTSLCLGIDNIDIDFLFGPKFFWRKNFDAFLVLFICILEMAAHNDPVFLLGEPADSIVQELVHALTHLLGFKVGPPP